jgi:hypothetical protein
VIDSDDDVVDDVICDPAMATDDGYVHWSDWCSCERPCIFRVLESNGSDEGTYSRMGTDLVCAHVW